jgi:hypothetical protein
VADELGNPDVIKPDINESTIDIFLGDEVADSMHNQESAKDVLIPDIYSDEHATTVPNLDLVDSSPVTTDKSTGVNPYDTAVLRKK